MLDNFLHHMTHPPSFQPLQWSSNAVTSMALKDAISPATKRQFTLRLTASRTEVLWCGRDYATELYDYRDDWVSLYLYEDLVTFGCCGVRYDRNWTVIRRHRLLVPKIWGNGWDADRCTIGLTGSCVIEIMIQAILLWRCDVMCSLQSEPMSEFVYRLMILRYEMNMLPYIPGLGTPC